MKCRLSEEYSASQKKGGDNTQTPICPNLVLQNVKMRNKAVSDCRTSETEIRELKALIARLTSEFATLKTKLDEVTISLHNCYERMDELNDLNIQLQQGFRNETEIVGIPEGNNENLEHIVKVAAQKVGAQLEDVDVDWITHVKPLRLAASPNVPDSGSRKI
ncbi:unnamed protein product [Parnassius apollo]|uniref:(apollo) hypothetical protein n=1 Tax=Parnassius apollo TaxID=110799 RepID=A0A8S3XE06_PARAO|nr:unnamed protein product [Parnassius apollo]